MWNIGTTGNTASCDQMLRTPGIHAPIALSVNARCEYNTPLGLPVVPEV